MGIGEKMEKIADMLKVIEEIINKSNTTRSPKLERILKGIQSVEIAHSALKQAQQVQELLQLGKDRTILNNISADNALPLLLLLFNVLSAPEASNGETTSEA